MRQSGRPPTWILCFTSFNHLALVVLITITITSTLMISNDIRNEINYRSKGLQRFCQLSDLLLVWERLQASASQCSSIAAALSKVPIHNINTTLNSITNNNNNKHRTRQQQKLHSSKRLGQLRSLECSEHQTSGVLSDIPIIDEA